MLHIVVVDDGSRMHGQLQVEDDQGWRVVWTCTHQHLKESSARGCAVREQARQLPGMGPKEDSIEAALNEAENFDPAEPEYVSYDIAKLLTELEARGWVFRPDDKEGTRLEWHKGTHGWLVHDDYRRHGHSENGVLTIDPKDSTLHFEGGKPFPS